MGGGGSGIKSVLSQPNSASLFFCMLYLFGIWSGIEKLVGRRRTRFGIGVVGIWDEKPEHSWRSGREGANVSVRDLMSREV